MPIDNETLAPWSKKYTNEIYLTDSYTGETTKLYRVVSSDILWESMVKGEVIVTNKAVNNDVRILILGDSYSNYMMPYLSQNIKSIILTHYRECAKNKKEINVAKLLEKYNPDAIVLEMLEDSFFHSREKSLFKNIKF